jgi:NADH pyrophosphatase NudC (nudix superfamily)
MNNYFPSDEWPYCPWCGEKSFRAGHENYLQCDACRKKFYINASSAVACIIENPKGKLLLTRRAFDPAKGMLDLPGGFVSLNETAEDAVRREIKEELNLEVTSLQYIGSAPNRYQYGNMLYFTLDLGFKCFVSDFSKIRVADDVNGYEFLPHQSIDLQEICFPSIRNILIEYFSK